MKKLLTSSFLCATLLAGISPAQAARYSYDIRVPPVDSCERPNAVLEFLGNGYEDVVYRHVTCCNGDEHYGGNGVTAWAHSYTVDTCQDYG